MAQSGPGTIASQDVAMGWIIQLVALINVPLPPALVLESGAVLIAGR